MILPYVPASRRVVLRVKPDGNMRANRAELVTQNRALCQQRARHSTLARENGADLVFKRRQFRQHGRSVLKSGQDLGTVAAFEAANGIPR